MSTKTDLLITEQNHVPNLTNILISAEKHQKLLSKENLTRILYTILKQCNKTETKLKQHHVNKKYNTNYTCKI